MSDLTRFIKSSGIYFLGSILSKLIVFFMLPICTRYLNPSEFGEYDLSLAYIQFFLFLFYPDIWVGIMKYIILKKNISVNYKNSQIISTGFCLFFICTVFYILFFCLFLDYKNIKFPYALIVLGFTLALHSMYAYILRAFDKNFYFVISGVIDSVICSISTFILLYFIDKNYEALIMGSIIGKILAIIIMQIFNPISKDIKFNNFDFEIFKKILIFCFPLIFNSFAWWFAAVYGKVLIADKLSLEDNGYYAIALKFSFLLSFIILCFRMSWQEISFSKVLNKDESSIFYSNVCYNYLKFMLLGVILLLPIIKLLFPFIINLKFDLAMKYIPGALFGAIIYGFNDFLTSIINTINKNKYLSICTIIGSVFNVILLHIFIGEFGVFAVIYSYIVCYFIICILMIVVINYSFKIRLKYINISFFVLCFYIQSFVFANMSVFYNIITFFIFLFLSVFLYKNELLFLIQKFKIVMQRI